MDDLTFEQQVFVLAHETCHIAFKHFIRCLDKPVKDVERRYEEYCKTETSERKRELFKLKMTVKYNKIWNIATDACINAFLKKDGLEMPEGVIDKKTGKPRCFVNIEDGLYRRAEVIYDALVKKEEEKEKKSQQDKEKNQSQSGNDTGEENSQNRSVIIDDDTQGVGGGLDDIDIDNYEGIDSHDNWAKDKEEKDLEEEKEQEEKETQKKKKSIFDKIKDIINQSERKNEDDDEDKKSKDADEKNKKALDELSEDEEEIFNQNKKELDKKKNNSNLNSALNNVTKEVGVKHDKIPKPVLSWKDLLLRSVEEETQMWGYRRSNRYMPGARIQEVSYDGRAKTEVILDTSGSISTELLKGFLRQLVPLFRETEIKVGCFAGEFHGFTELKSIDEIENFKATRDNGGTNYEAAATSFSENRGMDRINKIVFTDGALDMDSSHKQKTKVDDILWIVFGNKMNFKPVGGKIIRVSDKDLSEMLSIKEISPKPIKYVQTEDDIKNILGRKK